MAPKKSKKKAQAGNTRGFATTSIPAKAKEVSRPITPEPIEQELLSIDVAEQAAIRDKAIHEELLAKTMQENSHIVDAGMKAYNRVLTDMDVDKRNRAACIQISLPEDHITAILRLCRAQDKPVVPKNVDELDTLKDLYAAEQLLRKIGLSDTIVQQLLSTVADLSRPETLLEHLVLTTEQNVEYEGRKRHVVLSKHEPYSSSTSTTAPRNKSRMTELLSDEEDQNEIEKDPTGFYVSNQLELLTIQAQSKANDSDPGEVARLKKRSLVIANQLSFDHKAAQAEIRRIVQTGYLKKAAIASRTAQMVSSIHCTTTAELEEIVPDPISDATLLQRNNSPDSSLSDNADNDDDDGDDVIDHEKSVTADAITADIDQSISSPSSEVSDEVLMTSTMFMENSDDSSSSSIVEAAPVVQRQPESDARISFPYVLPKSSSNISPAKLLQTYLKRADKQAQEEYDAHSNRLTIRFSSAKVTRKKVVIDDTTYRFPDVETTRNYLYLKALFSVPELASEKAGTRFSGTFKAVWQLLESQEEELQKAAIALKVQNVRDIYALRASTLKDMPDPSTVDVNSTIAAESDHFSKPGIRDGSSDIIFQLWDHIRTSDGFAHMLEYRNTLPIAAYREALLDSIDNNQVTILCGETGCGKSTQLPTFILEDALSRMSNCKIYVTEPRRISAISLATRVSAELGESRRAIAAGESLLGFSIRLDSQVSERSRLIYATTGIVLRMLEDNTDLGGITHLIIDEVHERSIESDFLLIVVKRLLRTRRDLRVVLMSATLQSERFNEYFGGHCSIFNVPGRTYPVEQFFLEDAIERCEYVCDDNSYYAKRGILSDTRNDWEIPDDPDDDCSNEDDLITYSDRTIRALKVLDPYKINYDLVCLLLEHLDRDVDRSLTQAVLIFLPGIGEIRRLLEILQAHKIFGDYRKWTIYPLHSSIPNEKQQAAFDVPPGGVRKIVIATNIAETGITIPDITCVIDTGKHKESRFDARRQLNKLVETFIAKSNAKQRMGRAGRVQPGICFHLFSKARFERMAEHQLPEFQRLNLDELALRVKTVQLGGIEDVLLEALDAPTAENVKRSIVRLIEVGALDVEEALTPLGRHLAKLPVDITLGKLILSGVRYACLDPCLVVAATLSSKTPFETPIGREREASNSKQLFIRGESDFLTIWTAYSKWRTVCEEKPQHEHKFCRDSFLSAKNLGAIEELRLQYLKILVDSGLFPVSESDRRGIQRARFTSSRDGFVSLPSSMSANNTTIPLIEACLTSAFYPNLINVHDGFRTIAKGQPVTIHPSSTNYHKQSFSKRWITFFGLLKTKVATHAHDTGLVDDYIVALFCGTQVDIRPFSGIISLDHNRVKFKTRDLRTLMVLGFLRENLQKQFAAFLDRQPVDDRWLEILQEIVASFEAVAKQKLK